MRVAIKHAQKTTWHHNISRVVVIVIVENKSQSVSHELHVVIVGLFRTPSVWLQVFPSSYIYGSSLFTTLYMFVTSSLQTRNIVVHCCVVPLPNTTIQTRHGWLPLTTAVQFNWICTGTACCHTRRNSLTKTMTHRAKDLALIGSLWQQI